MEEFAFLANIYMTNKKLGALLTFTDAFYPILKYYL
jgi:hypothetical protein